MFSKSLDPGGVGGVISFFQTSEKCLLENTLGNTTLVQHPPSTPTNFVVAEGEVQRGEESDLQLYIVNGRVRPGGPTSLHSWAHNSYQPQGPS